MFLSTEIKEYNLFIINLNYLIREKIELDIDNFLYDNNLSIEINKKDLTKIINHYVITNIISFFKEEYNNILIFNEELFKETNSLKDELILHNLKLIIKKFNFNYFEITSNFVVDTNTIYKIKSIIQNKKLTDLRKIESFCKKNDLLKLSKEVKNNIKTKLILHK